MDFYFEKQEALYGWIFQYMPIGRSYTLDLMVTPQQRKWMFEKEQQLIRDKSLFIADFWNSGAVANGCISGGRPGGYPVPFIPTTLITSKKYIRKKAISTRLLCVPSFRLSGSGSGITAI